MKYWRYKAKAAGPTGGGTSCLGFLPPISHIKNLTHFTDRGWNTASGKASEAVTHENIVLNLSENAYIDNTGKVRQLVCGCKPEASKRHQCRRSCTCATLGKGCHPILCGRKGRCDHSNAALQDSFPEVMRWELGGQTESGVRGSGEQVTLDSDTDGSASSDVSSEYSEGSGVDDVDRWPGGVITE